MDRAARYRAAVIGCGRIGSQAADDPRLKAVYSHAQAYSMLDSTELVAVCDADANRAEECAKRWGLARSFTVFSAMIEAEKPDIVSVCTPDGTHASILQSILRGVSESGSSVRGVLSEKPLAMDVDAGASIAALSKELNVPLAVNYTRRYAKSHSAARERIQAGEIGEILHITGYYTKGVVHNGSHWIDLAQWIAGDIYEVRGWGEAGDLDPTLSAQFRFSSGAQGALFGCADDCYTIFEMDILGSRGRMRFSDFGLRQEWFRVADTPYYSGYHWLQKDQETNGPPEDTVLWAIEDIVRCVGDRTTPVCSAHHALGALRVATATIESARSGCSVRIG